MSANYMSATVCPSPPLSTEIAVLKGTSIHHRLCLADDASIHLLVMGTVMGTVMGREEQ